MNRLRSGATARRRDLFPSEQSSPRVKGLDLRSLDCALLIPCQLRTIKRSWYARRSRARIFRTIRNVPRIFGRRGVSRWKYLSLFLSAPLAKREGERELDRLSFDQTLIAPICLRPNARTLPVNSGSHFVTLTTARPAVSRTRRITSVIYYARFVVPLMRRERLA